MLAGALEGHRGRDAGETGPDDDDAGVRGQRAVGGSGAGHGTSEGVDNCYSAVYTQV